MATIPGCRACKFVVSNLVVAIAGWWCCAQCGGRRDDAHVHAVCGRTCGAVRRASKLQCAVCRVAVCARVCVCTCTCKSAGVATQAHQKATHGSARMSNRHGGARGSAAVLPQAIDPMLRVLLLVVRTLAGACVTSFHRDR